MKILVLSLSLNIACSLKNLVQNGSNELLEEQLASKLSKQQADPLFFGAAMKKYKKPAFLKICLGNT